MCSLGRFYIYMRERDHSSSGYIHTSLLLSNTAAAALIGLERADLVRRAVMWFRRRLPVFGLMLSFDYAHGKYAD